MPHALTCLHPSHPIPTLNCRDSHPHPLRPLPRNRKEQVTLHPHIRLIRFKQLQHTPIPLVPRLPTPKPRKHRRGAHIQLHPRQVHAQAVPRPPRERRQEPLQPGVVQPPLRHKRVRVRKDARVVVRQRRRHADRRARGDRPLAALQRRVGRDARAAARRAVREALAFFEDRGEEGELLERGERDLLLLRVLGGGIAELVFEAAEEPRLREEVIGEDGEDP